MTSLAVTEINETGIIITVATEQTTFWQSVLPTEGDCLFTFADATTNKQLTAFINKIFASAFPVEYALFVNALPIQLIGCQHASGLATIYWKHRNENEAISTEPANLSLKLLDYTFKRANSPIQLIKEDGTMYDFNDAMCTMLGYTIEEYKHITFYDTDPYKNKEGYTILWKNLQTIGDLIIYRKLITKNGNILEVEINACFISFEGKELICCFVHDITDKKKIDERLKIVNFAFHNAVTPILLIKEDGTIYDCNQAALNLFWYTKEQMLGLKSYQLNPLLTKECRQQLWADLRTKGSVMLQRGMNHRNGNWMLLDIKANLVTYNGIELSCVFINDIAEKQKLQDRLNVVDYSFQHVSTPILMTQSDGTFYDFNGALLTLLGYSHEEMLQLKVKDVAPFADDTQRKTIWETIRAQKTILQQRQMVRKDGTIILVEIRANLLIIGDLEINCAFIIDITEKKKEEEEKLKLINELLETNKELLQFSYITSHNLRAPVTNLIAICRRLHIENFEDKQTKQLIQGFKQSTQLLNDTLNDLIKILIIKENTSITTNNVRFEEILDKVKSTVSVSIVQNVVKLVVDFTAAPTVNFNNIYLESIMLNLLTNAIKYAHPSRYPIITIKSFTDEEGMLKLSFTDNGLGMDLNRVKHKIFGLYQRFHNNPDGKGIGLYLIHSQITALGGAISVDSTVGEGTTFTITFPQRD